MYRYQPEYELQISANRNSNDRLRSYFESRRLHHQPSVHENFMERVQQFVNENFFFRIEGVDDMTAPSESAHNHGDTKTKSFQMVGKDRHIFEQPPEIVVEETKIKGSVSSPELVQNVELTQPTQLSCLSLSIYSAVIIGMICIFLFIGRDYVKYILLSLEEADFWISLIVFCFLFTIVSFPMTWGYILLNISAGYLYGLGLGLIIVISCALTGLFIAHCVIRRCLRNFVLTKFTNKSFLSIMNVVDHSSIGFKVVIWARLTPIPFGLQNALFGVCGIGTPRYIMASALGMLPTQGMHAYIGSTLRSMEEVISDSSGSTTAYLVFGAQLIIAIGLLTFVIRRARSEFNRMVQDAQAGPAPAPGSPLSALGPPLSAPTPALPSKSETKLAPSETKAHSRSASSPVSLMGSLGVTQGHAHIERSRTGSFSPKNTSTREHSH